MTFSMEEHEDFAARADVLGGVPVWGIVPGSAMDCAGFCGGDIVLCINGAPGKSVAGTVGRDAFGRLEFQVLRGDRLLVLRLPNECDPCVVEELDQQLFGRTRRCVA